MSEADKAFQAWWQSLPEAQVITLASDVRMLGIVGVRRREAEPAFAAGYRECLNRAEQQLAIATAGLEKIVAEHDLLGGSVSVYRIARETLARLEGK